ncbi:MAG: DNA repair protein RecN [Nitrospirae bacterium]|nr:DNA repair protein RecN [Candidatus Troglogloeales bacterium]MBI3598168.1 DNA repair protein RecN [Candidatus Troglogloeales bacterium]
MLRELRLHNYAIITDLLLTFEEGLIVITGETGSGKSILVEAIALLLGERSDGEPVRHESDEAVLEARFDDHDSDGIILKRVLSAGKLKSRVYINDSLANLASLKQAGEHLAEIHGQHDHTLLINPDYPISILDAYGKLSLQKEQYQTHFQERAHLLNEITNLKKALSERDVAGGTTSARRQEDFLLYQLSEIRSADLKIGEEESLEKEERGLKNWESILSTTARGNAVLSEEGGILSQIGNLEQQLRMMSKTTEDADAEMNLLHTANINLKELALLLRDRANRVSFDPERQQIVTERLYLIQKMQKKYGGSIEVILDLKAQMENDLSCLLEGGERLSAMEQALSEISARLTKEAEALSKKRIEAIGPFEKRVKEELALLGMEKTRFQISNQQKPLSEDGIDEIQFLIALPGELLKSITKVASGGELSRLMLSLKVVVSNIDPVPTYVFDEIDAGIGGAIAERIGKRLSKLSKQHQVFCVTHLPQIARFADHHYVVEKKTAQKRVMTTVRKLSQEERVTELARMLGGVTITSATLRHAEELSRNR